MSERVNLVVQSYGQENEYRRAILSVWSFYAHVSDRYRQTKTLLYTDNPAFFEQYFNDLPVEYLLLTAEQFKAFRGKSDFIHRIKIALIEDAFKRSGADLLYVDSDTFFTADPSPLLENLSQRAAFMHLREYSFADVSKIPLPSGAPFHAVLKYIQNNDFSLSGGRRQKFSPALYSWNAGVMVLHHAHKSLLPDVYAVTDQLFDATGNHASEQYAFSLILQMHTEISPCDRIVYHYWYRIKKNLADHFLSRNIDTSWRKLLRNEKDAMVRKWTLQLPTYFENHLLMIKDNAVQAFNTNDFRRGYTLAFRALIRNPFSITFIRDVVYHTRRFLSGA